MRLSRYEKETIILLNAAEDTASIYTAVDSRIDLETAKIIIDKYKQERKR